MGVYIPFAKKLPCDCNACFVAISGCKVKNPYINGRPSDCPLVEVKPHGRLIDADALMGKAFRYQIHGKTTLKVVLASALRDAPTIIETEGEDGSIG